jgi:hypothetical protein
MKLRQPPFGNGMVLIPAAKNFLEDEGEHSAKCRAVLVDICQCLFLRQLPETGVGHDREPCDAHINLVD